jgi:hypothetical protein
MQIESIIKGSIMMKNIKFGIAVIALSSLSLFAGDLKLLPVMDSSYSPNFAIAAVGGVEKFDSVKAAGSYGVELSLNCPLLQLPSNVIRQQVTLVRSSSEGLTTTALEINPHAQFPIVNKLNFGFGPSLSAVYASANSQSHMIYGIGAGASLTYNLNDKYFAGIESRYEWANTARLGGANYDMDNTRTLLKFGTHF